LHDVQAASTTAGPKSGGLPGNTSQAPPFGQPVVAAAAAPAKFPTAEEEKQRLQREERERILSQQPQAAGTSGAGAPAYETAEDEKKRLERQEREKVLSTGGAGGGAGDQKPKKPDGGDEPPPPEYQDMASL
jgi:hypothetical protein